jgi:hypothetical protein
MEITNRKKEEPSFIEGLSQSQINRRRFLRYSGIFGASAVVIGSTSSLAGCHKDDNNDGIMAAAIPAFLIMRMRWNNWKLRFTPRWSALRFRV